LFDFAFNHINQRIKDGNRAFIFTTKVFSEVLAVGVSLFLINIPQQYSSFELRQLNPSNLFELLIYYFYIVFFNSVSFFTVEYCIGIFRKENKKNYSKYFFIYNHNILKRVWRILRNALPQTLEKIRNNITWLIMFIIPVETILENTESIGSNLLDSYQYSGGSLYMIRNISYLLIIMFIINTSIDLIIVLFHRKQKNILNESEKNEEHNIERLYSPNQHLLFKILAAVVVLVSMVFIYNFNNREYVFAGYYDFSVDDARTVGDLFKNEQIGSENCSPDIIEAYRDVPLYRLVKGTNYYSIIQLEIEDENGKNISLIPYYEASDRSYYYISGSKNLKNIRSISSTDKITTIKSIIKYPNIAFTGINTAYRLPADTNRTMFYEKPLYLVIPFYIFYFLVLIIITIIFTIALNSFMGRCLFSKDSRLKQISGFIGIAFKEFLNFLNALTLIIVFLLVNLLLQKTVDISWQNQSFSASVLSYSFIQFIIIFMFSAAFINEIIIHVKKILGSKEFEYYRIIGMNSRSRYLIYKRKYGSTLQSKLIFQNILFVFNINWFICYAFNIWNQFNDSIGVTYSISFENIFTKIIHNQTVNTGIYNFIILAGINVVLFAVYYIYQKRLSSE
jgi:hypothetical protein